MEKDGLNLGFSKTRLAGKMVRVNTHAAATPIPAKMPKYIMGGMFVERDRPAKPAIVVKEVKVIGLHIFESALKTSCWEVAVGSSSIC